VGNSDFIWGLNALGGLLRLMGTAWVPYNIKSEAQFYDIEALGDAKILFAVATDGKLYKIDTNTNQMIHIPTPSNMLQVRATCKSILLGLDSKGILHIRDTDTSDEWKSFGPPMHFKCISCGKKRRFRKPAEIWAVGIDDKPYRWDRNTKTWVSVPDRLLKVSVAQDNTVYGIRKYDNRLVKFDSQHYWVPQDSLVSKPIVDISAYGQGKNIMVVDREGAPGSRTSVVLTRKSLEVL
jgi:hypothetical protein